MMEGRLGLLSVLLTFFAFAGAKASLEKYAGQLSGGEDGFRERCLIRYVLHNEVRRYAGEAVVESLRSDLRQLAGSLGEDEKQFGVCSKFSRCFKVSEVKSRTDLGSVKFDHSKCVRWMKFSLLCKMIRERPTIDEQMLAVERWVCQLKDELKISDGDRMKFCQTSTIKQLAEDEAGEEFYSLAFSTNDELEEAKLALGEEIALEMREKAAHDAKATELAFAVIKNGLAVHMPIYKRCLSKLN